MEKKTEAKLANKAEYRVGEFLIKHEPVLKSKWIEGDLLAYRAIEILYQQDYFEQSVRLAKKYYEELIRRFDTGRRDELAIPILSGYAFDFGYSNIIHNDDGLHQIDLEFKGELPADYILFRNLSTTYNARRHMPVFKYIDLSVSI